MDRGRVESIDLGRDVVLGLEERDGVGASAAERTGCASFSEASDSFMRLRI